MRHFSSLIHTTHTDTHFLQITTPEILFYIQLTSSVSNECTPDVIMVALSSDVFRANNKVRFKISGITGGIGIRDVLF